VSPPINTKNSLQTMKVSWPGSDNTKAGYNSAAMSQQCSSAATSRHFKIGWFRVIKGGGLGCPPANQHQLMDQ